LAAKFFDFFGFSKKTAQLNFFGQSKKNLRQKNLPNASKNDLNGIFSAKKPFLYKIHVKQKKPSKNRKKMRNRKFSFSQKKCSSPTQKKNRQKIRFSKKK
jgi:hypothetical protein